MALTGEGMASYVAMLKEWYTSKRIEWMVYQNAPTFAMMPKNSEIGGETYDVPLGYGDPQAGSTRFAVAQANKTPTKTTKFQIAVKEEYSFAQIGRKVIKAAEKDRGAFLPAVKPNVDGAFRTCKRNLCIQIHGTGTGSKARILSGGTTTTWTLTEAYDTMKFQVGERLQLDNVDGGGTYPGTLTDGGTQVEIVGINRQAGTLEVADVLVAGLVAASANGDYIFRAGDYDNVISGWRAWIPDAAPTSTPFNGVNRATDTDMLGGVRFDGSALVLSEAFTNGLTECVIVGDGEPDHVFAHPKQVAKLVDQLGAKVEWQEYKVTETIGYEGFKIRYDGGTARVFPDRYCPTTRALGASLESWEFLSMGPCPEIFDAETDQEMLREADIDGYEVRIGGYPEVSCCAPGHNVNMELPAL